MFNKNPETMSLEKLIIYITKTFHEPLRKELIKLDTFITDIINNNLKEYPQLINLQELFHQFKTEVLKHITREDLVVFPTILKLY